MTRLYAKIYAVAGICALFLAWAVLSWERWPDCFIDFGKELYIPWQITQGKVLYRDIFYYYGPLAKYFHAFLFKSFGPALHVLFVTNFILLFITALLIYFLFKYLRGFWAGMAAVYVFIGVFAFGRYVPTGNYNYICPYSHELLYGLVLSLLGLLFIRRWIDQPRAFYSAVLGFLTGLIFLTKVEVFLAFFVSLVTVQILVIFHEKPSFTIFIRRSLVFFCFAVVPPLLFCLYLSRWTGLQQACFYVILQPYILIRKMGAANIFFYKTIAGVDSPLRSLSILLTSAAGYLAAILTIGFLSHIISRLRSGRMWFIVGLTAIVVAAVAVIIKTESIFYLERGAPLLMLILVLAGFARFFKLPPSQTQRPKLIFQIAFTMYALVLMFKIFLHVTPFHFGFVLSMPAALFLAAILTTDMACVQRGRFYRPKVFRALAFIFLAGILIVHFRASKKFYAHMNYPLGQVGDHFLGFDENGRFSGYGPIGYRSALLNEIVRWVNQNTSSKDTITVFPEGIMANYLTKRENPVRIYDFVPGMVDLFGENTVIEWLEKSPPSYIVVIRMDISQLKSGLFGIDYNKRIYQWILQNYDSKVFWGQLAVIMQKKNI